jgi:hypothetical protein
MMLFGFTLAVLVILSPSEEDHPTQIGYVGGAAQYDVGSELGAIGYPGLGIVGGVLFPDAGVGIDAALSTSVSPWGMGRYVRSTGDFGESSILYFDRPIMRHDLSAGVRVGGKIRRRWWVHALIPISAHVTHGFWGESGPPAVWQMGVGAGPGFLWRWRRRGVLVVDAWMNVARRLRQTENQWDFHSTWRVGGTVRLMLGTRF